MNTASTSTKTALALFAVGVFMAGLDNGIVSSSLTTLIHSFRVTASWGVWIITVYTLGLAVSVPIMAKLSDRYGRKRLYVIAAALFGIGSLSVALSHTFWMLILSRAVEALGAGGIFPIASGYVLATIPAQRQGQMLGMIGGMNGMSAVIGPGIGSLILELTGSWYWLFWINVPIALALVVGATWHLQESRSSRNDRMDVIGIVMLSLGILALLYGLTHLSRENVLHDICAPSVYAFVLTGLALIALFLIYEDRVANEGRNPLIPIALLHRAASRWTLLAGLASGLILSAIIFLPAFVQAVLGWPATEAGYWLTPLAIFSAVGSIGGGRLMDRHGPMATLVFGFIADTMGSLLFPLWVSSTWQMVIASAIIGLGVGITMGAPLKILITEHVRDNKTTALGFLSLVRVIGMTIGPIVYAGFLTRSMMRVPQLVVARFHDVGIPWTHQLAKSMVAVSTRTTLGNVAEGRQLIPPGPWRSIIYSAEKDSMAQGFHRMFWTSAVISMIGLGAVLITALHRRRTAPLTFRTADHDGKSAVSNREPES